MKLLLLVFLLALGGRGHGQSVTTRYSGAVGDSFAVYLDTLQPTAGGETRYVYYLDAGIRSGKELRRQLAGRTATGGGAIVFVGIAHRGNFHAKRRRDFIPSHSAAAFYRFLQAELIPFIETAPVPQTRRALIGHSFGGLFTMYALFREEQLFGRYFALSPSLWVDRYALFGQEAAFAAQQQRLPAFLYLSAGGAEAANHILAGNRRMKALLEQRNYSGLQCAYEVQPNATHNRAVPLSLRYVLAHLF